MGFVITKWDMDWGHRQATEKGNNVANHEPHSVPTIKGHWLNPCPDVWTLNYSATGARGGDMAQLVEHSPGV